MTMSSSKKQSILKRAFVSLVVGFAVIALKFGTAPVINAYDDYTATADKTTSDAELRKQFIDSLHLNQFLETTYGAALKCIKNPQVRVHNGAQLSGLVEHYLPVDALVQSSYTREDLQKSIQFLSTPAGQAFVKAWANFMQKIISLVEVDGAGKPVPSSMAAAKNEALPIISNVVASFNFIQKIQVRHFVDTGLSKKFEALHLSILSAGDDVVDNAAVRNPALDQQIKPLLDPYYAHYNVKGDDSCRQLPAAP